MLLGPALNLPDALNRKYCPICRLLRTEEERLIWFLLYESTGDPQLRVQWDRGGGFCNYHNALMKEIVTKGRLLSGSSIARIYDSILDCYQKDLQKLSTISLTASLSGKKDCYFCQKRKESEINKTDSFTNLLETYEGCKSYESSEGLCNPHFMVALSRVNKNDKTALRQFLIEDHKFRMRKLKNKISNLQRAERYDALESLTEEERHSWEEVLWRFAGVNYKYLLTWEKDE